MHPTINCDNEKKMAGVEYCYVLFYNPPPPPRKSIEMQTYSKEEKKDYNL